METHNRYFLVGLFVLLTLLGIAGFSVWLAERGDKAEYTEYRIRFAESVSGLPRGGAVKFRGVDVGTVDNIVIDPADTRLIRVRIRIRKDTPVKTDTKASLKLQGITGAVYIELTGGGPEAQMLMGTEDSPPEIPAEASSINAIVNRAPEVLEKASKVADQLNKLMSDDNVNHLNHTLAQWDTISTALAEQTRQTQQLLATSNQVASDVHAITQSSRQDITDLTRNLNHAAEQVDQLAAQIKGGAGGQLEELTGVMVELKKTSREVRNLASSLQREPSRLIRPTQDAGVPAP